MILKFKSYLVKTQNHNDDTKFKNIPAAIKVAPATSFDKCNLSQMTSKTGMKKSSQIYTFAIQNNIFQFDKHLINKFKTQMIPNSKMYLLP